MKLRKSATSPMRISSIIATMRSRTSGHSDAGMYARDAALHFCPWYSYAPRDEAHRHLLRLGRRVRHHEVLAAVSPTMRGYER